MTVTRVASIQDKPSIRTCSSRPTDGTHAQVSRMTPPSRTRGNRLTAQTAAAHETSPAQPASTVRARVGTSALTMLPKNGKRMSAATDMVPDSNRAAFRFQVHSSRFAGYPQPHHDQLEIRGALGRCGRGAD